MSGGAAKFGMTSEQAYATRPDVTAWVAASAGTGKTHVLTARVLRLMLTGTRPENITCLTFTKAAAAEMKNRIFRELGTWTTLSDEQLKEVILTRTEEKADTEMLARARELFAEILDLRGGLQIQTFHSFCQSLLGRFPLEAELNPGFEALDETGAADLMQTAKDRMLASSYASADEGLKKALALVAGLVTENTFDEIIDRLAFEVGLIRKARSHYGSVEQLLDAIYRQLQVSRSDTDAQFIEKSCAEDAFDRQGLVTLLEAMDDSKLATDQKHAKFISAFLSAENTDRTNHYNAYKNVFLTAQGGMRVTIATKNVLNKDTNLSSVIEAEQNRIFAIEDKRSRLRGAKATEALLTLGLSQINSYQMAKQQKGLVDFDDMIDRTVSLFGEQSMAPWILYKLDNRIDHILVDEAQDTNRDQWRVVETLAAEFFAGETARDTTRTVFAVGDAKQSIFSFQKADPKQFIAARDRVFKRAENAGLQASSVPLDLSFRSSEAVLSLVDQVFAEGASAVQGLSPDAEPVEHKFTRTGMAGLVELWPLEAPRAKPATLDGWEPPVHQENIDDAQQRTARHIAEHIKSIVGQRTLDAKARPVAAGDILVLVRRRTAFVDYLTRALKAAGVPVAGRDRMHITEELPVMDLINAARFALAPDDDLALAVHLKSPLVGMGEEDLFDLAYGRTGSLWDSLYKKRGQERYGIIYNELIDLLNEADRDGPFEFFNHLLVEQRGRKKLARRLGPEIHDPIDELLNEALKYELQYPASLLGFLEHITRNNSQIKRDMEAAGDKVRIMTAHSAKGLQAPIVYLSDITSLPDQRREGSLLPLEADEGGAPVPVWTSPIKNLPEIIDAKAALKEKQLTEYRRLLYVAMTRAEDELYVAGWRGPREPDANCWYNAISEGFNRVGAEETENGLGMPVKRYSVLQTASVTPSGNRVDKEHAPRELPDWVHAPMPIEPSPSRPLAPSRPEVEPAVTGPVVRRNSDRYRRGVLLHSLLQWLPDVPIGGREAAVEAYLSRVKKLKPDETTEFWQEARSVLEHPEFAPLFGPDSRAEVPVAGLVPTPSEPLGRAVSGQVDRLVELEDRILLVDYKTNRPPPQAVEQVPAVYLRQMALYRRAIQSIYPGKSVKTALLWTDQARLMELPEALTEEALEASRL